MIKDIINKSNKILSSIKFKLFYDNLNKTKNEYNYIELKNFLKFESKKYKILIILIDKNNNIIYNSNKRNTFNRYLNNKIKFNNKFEKKIYNISNKKGYAIGLSVNILYYVKKIGSGLSVAEIIDIVLLSVIFGIPILFILYGSSLALFSYFFEDLSGKALIEESDLVASKLPKISSKIKIIENDIVLDETFGFTPLFYNTESNIEDGELYYSKDEIKSFEKLTVNNGLLIDEIQTDEYGNFAKINIEKYDRKNKSFVDDSVKIYLDNNADIDSYINGLKNSSVYSEEYIEAIENKLNYILDRYKNNIENTIIKYSEIFKII